MSITASLVKLDRALFFFINDDLHNSFLDIIIPPLRNKWFWVPLYIALLAYFIYKFQYKSIILIMAAVLMVVISDQGAGLFKNQVQRLRPCHNPGISKDVKLLVDNCGGQYGFVSAHASNHFALALFLLALFGRKNKWLLPIALSWAGIISLAQVYVGVHYPADIFCGAVFGSFIGFIFARLAQNTLKKFEA